MTNRRKFLIAGSIILALAIVFALTQWWSGRDKNPMLTHTPPSASDQPQGGTGLQNAQPLTPGQSLNLLLHAWRDWDLSTASQFIRTPGVEVFSEHYRDALAPFAERMEFNVNVERVTGNTAVVDVAVYAVDFEQALGDLTENAANYLVHRELDSSTPDWPLFLAEYVSRLENIEELMRIQRTAPAYLVQTENGNWVLDAEDPENAAFYNAVSGGLLDLLDKLEQVEPAEA